MADERIPQQEPETPQPAPAPPQVDARERFAVYRDVRVMIPEGTSDQEVFEVMSRRFPELSNSTMLERANGDLEFVATSGEKGNR